MFVAGVNEDGQGIPMSFASLADAASELEELLPEGLPGSGALALLRTARSLFVHSWFDYEFMWVACGVGFQAVEAAFRNLYPDAYKVPFRALVARARKDGTLPANIADLADAGVDLRNLHSHPATAGAFPPGMAANMLETDHLIVALVLASAEKRRARA